MMILASILAIFFALLAGASKAIMDTLQFHYNESVFNRVGWRKFWDTQHSWKNKYKNGDPDQGPRFWLSTSWLVFLTDGWHLFQFIAWNSIFTVIFLIQLPFMPAWWIALISTAIIAGLFKLMFWLFYNKTLVK